MDQPVPASEVEAQTDKTEREQREEATRHAVRARAARREALRRNGADVGVSSDTLATDLEARLKQRDAEVKRRLAARKAAAAAVNTKRGNA